MAAEYGWPGPDREGQRGSAPLPAGARSPGDDGRPDLDERSGGGGHGPAVSRDTALLLPGPDPAEAEEEGEHGREHSSVHHGRWLQRQVHADPAQDPLKKAAIEQSQVRGPEGRRARSGDKKRN